MFQFFSLSLMVKESTKKKSTTYEHATLLEMPKQLPLAGLTTANVTLRQWLVFVMVVTILGMYVVFWYLLPFVFLCVCVFDRDVSCTSSTTGATSTLVRRDA